MKAILRGEALLRFTLAQINPILYYIYSEVARCTVRENFKLGIF